MFISKIINKIAQHNYYIILLHNHAALILIQLLWIAQVNYSEKIHYQFSINIFLKKIME